MLDYKTTAVNNYTPQASSVPADVQGCSSFTAVKLYSNRAVIEKDLALLTEHDAACWPQCSANTAKFLRRILTYQLAIARDIEMLAALQLPLSLRKPETRPSSRGDLSHE